MSSGVILNKSYLVPVTQEHDDPIIVLLGRRSARPRVRLPEGKEAQALIDGVVRGPASIATSALLFCPERNEREYQTRVSVEPSRGENLFVATSHWGPSGRVQNQRKVIYSGPDLASAVRKANAMIHKKLRREYRQKHPVEELTISLSSAVIKLRQLTEQF